MAQFPARDVPLIQSLLRWLRPAPALIEDDVWTACLERCDWIAVLDAERETRLRELTAQFLHEKTITPLAGLELDATERTLLAAICCLPLLQIGRSGMRGWSQLLVYPDAFRVQRSHVDAAGVLHEGDDELIGEAWLQGPLVLSWADVQADLEDPWSGFCVAVHEMAHKIDALDGSMDGTPLLPGAWQAQWAKDWQDAYDRFCEEVDRGDETAIDPYASTCPEEFFAVLSECHFSWPELLDPMPAVADHLRRLYGPAFRREDHGLPGPPEHLAIT